MHQPALANLSIYHGWLPSWLGRTQISMKSTAFYYIVFHFPAKVGIKCCIDFTEICIVPMMVAKHFGRRILITISTSQWIQITLLFQPMEWLTLTIKFQYYKQKYSSMPSFTYNCSQPIYSLTTYSCPPNEWKVDTKD